MNCRRIQNALEAGFTSTGFDIPADIREHLDDCADCRAYYEELADMADLLQPLDNLEMTPDESAGLLGGLEAAIDTAPRKKSVFGWVTSLLRPAIAAALVMIVAISVGPHMPGSPVIEADLNGYVFTQIDADDILPYLIDDDVDYLPEIDDQNVASYITGQLTSNQAEDVLDNASTEEIEWLMENFTLEI